MESLLRAFLAVAVYAVRFAPARLTIVSAAGIGVVLALLSLTRSFEFVALVLAWGIAYAGLTALRLSGPRTVRAVHVVSALGAFAATTIAVYGLTGKRGTFLLYGQSLDSQAGNLGGRRGRSDADVQLRARADEARPAVRRAVLPLTLLDFGLRGRCEAAAGRFAA